MEILNLAVAGYVLAAAAFTLITLLMLGRWSDRPNAGFIALASAATAVWAVANAVDNGGRFDMPAVIYIAELIRSLAWIVLAVVMLRDLSGEPRIQRYVIRYALVILVACSIFSAYFGLQAGHGMALTVYSGTIIAFASIVLMMAEQIFRRAPPDDQASIRYLCVALAGFFAYDLVVFSFEMIAGHAGADQRAVRGFVNAGFAAPLVLAARRSFRLPLDQYVPRQFLLYSFVLIGFAGAVIVILSGDYYIRTYGGEWSGVARVMLFAAVTGVAAVMLVSPTVRGRVRVFLMKSFFQYKYDYRKEWLRFIATLTDSERDNVSVAAVRAVAQIVNSPAGVVWAREQDGNDYLPTGAWPHELPIVSSVSSSSSLVRFLRQRQWVVDLSEMRSHPSRYEGLELPAWLTDEEDWWLIVPLFLQRALFGFVVLQAPRIVPVLNFEDHDLLRTVGRHVATHIHQAESDRRLAESSQFGAYNRLTAFLMHDLNNLIAQQSLVVKNAEKFRHNPDFVDDAIGTIANSVARMRRLMEQLTSTSEQTRVRDTDLGDVLRRAVKRCEPTQPKPRCEIDKPAPTVRADPERLITVIEHLLRNAQDATRGDGNVSVQLSVEGSLARIEIADDGCGMTPEFIRDRLFRPFDSTKGSQSMGIGAYQAREYMRQIGGQLDVASTPGSGTVFTIGLPVAD